MTLSVVPVDPNGIDNLAQGLTGFVAETAELQQSMMTTLFISGASNAWISGVIWPSSPALSSFLHVSAAMPRDCLVLQAFGGGYQRRNTPLQSPGAGFTKQCPSGDQ